MVFDAARNSKNVAIKKINIFVCLTTYSLGLFFCAKIGHRHAKIDDARVGWSIWGHVDQNWLLELLNDNQQV
jgi:hypothetical protein